VVVVEVQDGLRVAECHEPLLQEVESENLPETNVTNLCKKWSVDCESQNVKK
jgi:hypothetical protein